MQKILRKRVLRDLKENLFRYLALGFLIILGMYIVISLVGAADTIIIGVDKKAEENCLEDGQFSVFLPLTETEKENFEKQGILLEEMFYLDCNMENNETLRVFKNRKSIDLINLEQGTLAKEEQEIVLEKRYCEEHEIEVGDTITVGKKNFQVVGIGSVPDYDAMLKNLSDSTVDARQFGIAFVTEHTYGILKSSGSSSKAEEYIYAYRLNDKMSDKELKEKLKELTISSDDIEDSYFQEYWERTAGKKEEMQEGIQVLAEGSSELEDGLEELKSHNSELQEGADQILDAFLKEATESLNPVGLTKELTADNFEEVLADMKKNSGNAILNLRLNSILEQLREVKEYRDGVTEYTKGVDEAAKGTGELSDGIQELKNQSDEFMDEYFEIEISNMTQFLTAEDNPRVKASADDQVINKLAGLVAGVIVMILFTYVISVFVIHGIEKESSVIGALYALGAKRKDLMTHYLMLPVIITFIAGVIGTVFGYSKWGIRVQMQDCYDYYSLPELPTVYSMYLFLYGGVMPPVVAAIVNSVVIRKRLSQPVLTLMRSEHKNSKISNLNLGTMGFIGRFRTRQMLREARTSLTVIFGMFISLLIMMLGINTYVLCKHINQESKEDTKYEYMYTYKYPEEVVPEGGEACYGKTLKKEIFGYRLDITLLGIEAENPYFDAQVSKEKNQIVVSSAMAQKYQLRIGDKVVLTDEEEARDYAFEVKDITQFATGLYAFMDIESMRELFGESDDYYNVVFADHELDIDSGRLYAVTSKEEISKSSDVFVTKLKPMIYMMVVVSALIFCVVMYLMMKVMIDRSAFSISLIKIFGYRKKEIKKLYLNGNFYVVAVGAAICIPLSKKLMDLMYPVLISNVSCGMNLTFGWKLYLGIYLAVILMYVIINQLLVRRLNQVSPAEVLKNRE